MEAKGNLAGWVALGILASSNVWKDIFLGASSS